MSKKKEWKVPGELAALMEEAMGAEALRAVYVTEWFGFKKALKCSTIAEQRKTEFWDKVKKLYPDLPEIYNYNRADRMLRPGPAK
ncbi:MAG TPA: hypothetical protein VF516_03095 [Kofleriaceae bacterium]